MLASRLHCRWNCVVLPVVAAPLVLYAPTLCRSLLASPGVEAPLARLYGWLADLQ